MSTRFFSPEPPRHAEDELLLPAALRLPGRVRDARRPPGPAVPPPPPPPVGRPVGGGADQGLRPGPPRLHLPRRRPVDEELRGAPELRGPLLPLPGVRQPAGGAGAVHGGGAVGVVVLGTGELVSFSRKDDVIVTAVVLKLWGRV